MVAVLALALGGCGRSEVDTTGTSAPATTTTAPMSRWVGAEFVDQPVGATLLAAMLFGQWEPGAPHFATALVATNDGIEVWLEQEIERVFRWPDGTVEQVTPPVTQRVTVSVRDGGRLVADPPALRCRFGDTLAVDAGGRQIEWRFEVAGSPVFGASCVDSGEIVVTWESREVRVPVTAAGNVARWRVVYAVRAPGGTMTIADRCRLGTGPVDPTLIGVPVTDRPGWAPTSAGWRVDIPGRRLVPVAGVQCEQPYGG